jgi:hypothetical protein
MSEEKNKEIIVAGEHSVWPNIILMKTNYACKSPYMIIYSWKKSGRIHSQG